jgi:hypothetical protein
MVMVRPVSGTWWTGSSNLGPDTITTIFGRRTSRPGTPPAAVEAPAGDPRARSRTRGGSPRSTCRSWQEPGTSCPSSYFPRA